MNLHVNQKSANTRAVKMKLFAKTVFNSFSNKDTFKNLKAVLTKRVHIEIIRLQDLFSKKIFLYRARLKQELAPSHLWPVTCCSQHHSTPKIRIPGTLQNQKAGLQQAALYSPLNHLFLFPNIWGLFSAIPQVNCLCMDKKESKKETLLWLLCNTNSK